jgi:transposase
VEEITLVFDKGNNSEDNLRLIDEGRLHFVGSLVPTQHPDLLATPRPQMRRLDRSQLPAVWAYRTQKAVFGVNRTIVVTFNRQLFRAQQKTLTREINKRGTSWKSWGTNSAGAAPGIAARSRPWPRSRTL